jgi:hypothetical protein
MLAIAGMVGLIAGCGGVVTPVAGAAASGLVLADAASGAHYELSVADGALTLTGMGSAGTAEKDAGLVDSATVERIALADTVTAKTYELAVAAGALTLVPDDGGGR